MPHAIVPAVARCFIAGLLTWVNLAAPGVAQTVATKPDVQLPANCRFAQSARLIASLKSVPAVAAEFRRNKIDIADVGEPFVPFDVEDEKSRGLPHRQFLRGYEFKDRTIVWYYHGGFAAHVDVVALQMQPSNSAPYLPVLRLAGPALSGPPCEATRALLAGVVGSDG